MIASERPWVLAIGPARTGAEPREWDGSERFPGNWLRLVPMMAPTWWSTPLAMRLPANLYERRGCQRGETKKKGCEQRLEHLFLVHAQRPTRRAGPGHAPFFPIYPFIVWNGLIWISCGAISGMTGAVIGHFEGDDGAAADMERSLRIASRLMGSLPACRSTEMIDPYQYGHFSPQLRFIRWNREDTMSYWREHKIRERAYMIWEAEGRPDGKDAEHWLRAEAEISSEERDAAEEAELEAQGVI
jgi:hypothetical protein